MSEPVSVPKRIWDPNVREDKLLEHLNYLYHSINIFDKDVSIMVQGTAIKCHKAFLFSTGEFFRRAISENRDIAEIKIPDDFGITSATIKLIVDYIYSKELVVTNENLNGLRAASEKLGLREVNELCKAFKPTGRDSKLVDGQFPTIRSGLPSDSDKAGATSTKDAIPWGKGYYDTLKLWKPQPRGSILEHYLGYLWNQERRECADIVILTGGMSFKAHKIILACHSTYFRAYFSEIRGAIEMALPSSFRISAGTFLAILRFIYTSELVIETDNINDIYNAAVRLKMPHLVKVIEDKYSSIVGSINSDYPTKSDPPKNTVTYTNDQILPPLPQPIPLSNVAPSLMTTTGGGPMPIPQSYYGMPSYFQAPAPQPIQQSPPVLMASQGVGFSGTGYQQPYGYKTLTPGLGRALIQNLGQLYQSPDFLNLDINAVCTILSGDTLSLSNEREVFTVAGHWLRYRPAERFPYVDRIMACVRFTTMSVQELMDCVRNTIDWFKTNPRYRELIQSANWLSSNTQNGIPDTFVKPERPRNFMRNAGFNQYPASSYGIIQQPAVAPYTQYGGGTGYITPPPVTNPYPGPPPLAFNQLAAAQNGANTNPYPMVAPFQNMLPPKLPIGMTGGASSCPKCGVPFTPEPNQFAVCPICHRATLRLYVAT